MKGWGPRIDQKNQSQEAILKESTFQYGMKFSIENGFFIPSPSLAAEKQGPGLKFQARMKTSNENGSFVRGGMVYSCVRARMNFFDLWALWPLGGLRFFLPILAVHCFFHYELPDPRQRPESPCFRRLWGPRAPVSLCPHTGWTREFSVKRAHFLRVARLLNEVGTKDFLLRHEFSHEKCSEILPEIFEP